MSHRSGDEPLPLAISYYQLYCDITAVAASSSKEGATITEKTTSLRENGDPVKVADPQPEESYNHNQAYDNNNNNYHEQPPWVEDTEWDANREAAAERELRDNRERCRISSSASSSSSLWKNQSRSSHTNHKNDPHTAAWDQFYQHHQTSFFKDRHWPAIAFPNEFSNECGAGGVLVEVGCGVGNTLLPLLEKNKNDTISEEDRLNGSYRWTVYGLDLSHAAIELLQRDDRFQKAQQEHRAFAAVVDIAQPDSIPRHWLGVGTVTSLLFCLSAVDPRHHGTAVANAVATLRPGGMLVLRDYGRYDEAQMKLGRQRHKLLQDNFYRKHDGTCCYYFTIERIRELFLSTTTTNDNSTVMEELECRYIRRVYTNRLEQTQRRRVWVQARFRKKEFQH